MRPALKNKMPSVTGKRQKLFHPECNPVLIKTHEPEEHAIQTTAGKFRCMGHAAVLVVLRNPLRA